MAASHSTNEKTSLSPVQSLAEFTKRYNLPKELIGPLEKTGKLVKKSGVLDILIEVEEVESLFPELDVGLRAYLEIALLHEKSIREFFHRYGRPWQNPTMEEFKTFINEQHPGLVWESFFKIMDITELTELTAEYDYHPEETEFYKSYPFKDTHEKERSIFFKMLKEQVDLQRAAYQISSNQKSEQEKKVETHDSLPVDFKLTVPHGLFAPPKTSSTPEEQLAEFEATLPKPETHKKKTLKPPKVFKFGMPESSTESTSSSSCSSSNKDEPSKTTAETKSKRSSP